MEGVIEYRRRLREEAIRRAQVFAECVGRVGRVTTDSLAFLGWG